MKNLTTKRRFSVATLLAALLMFAAAGLFVSAPAQAATSSPAWTEVVLTNPEGTEGHIALSNGFSDQSLLFVVSSSTKGARNVTVPADGTVNVDFEPDWGVITVQYLDPGEGGRWWPLDGYTVPTVTPTPTQAASIAVNPVTGIATITLSGTGSYHVIVYGDLTRPADVVTSGSATIQVGPFTVLTPVKVNVYGDGSGSGKNLANAVVAPPVPPADDTETKKVAFCHATNPRAEAYVPLNTSIATFLQAGHGQHEGDIVPPFTYVKQGVQGSFPGNRWDAAGQAVFNNGCTVIPKPSPTPSETETPTPKPTATETETPKPTPTKTATATASPTTSSPAPVGNTPPATHQPVKSTSPVKTSSPTASRYPAALVDTAAGGGDGVIALPLLFFSVCAALLLIAGVSWLAGGEGSRRH